MAEASEQGSFFDLKAQLVDVLTSLVDAREAARFAIFVKEKVLPEMFARWRRDYPRVEQKLEYHQFMQAKLGVLEELLEGMKELASRVEPEEDNARAIMAEMQQLVGDARADRIAAGEV